MLRVTAADGSLRAVLVNYACHCTTLGGDFNKLCGDWAGYACEAIERAHPGAIALVTIGCGADANPNPRGSLQNAKDNGMAIAREVERLLEGTLAPLPARITGRLKRFELPFGPLPSRSQWEELAKKPGAVGLHAQTNLARLDRGEALPTTLPYVVQTWTFGDDLAMIFLAGEVVVDYCAPPQGRVRRPSALDQRLLQRRPLLHRLAARHRRGGLRGRRIDGLLRPPNPPRPRGRGPDRRRRPLPAPRAVQCAEAAIGGATRLRKL